MLNAAGARVELFGFRRADQPLTEVDGSPVVDLGRTYDARLMQRAFKVVERRFRLGVEGERVRGADVLLARNLEMLAVAAAAKRNYAPHAGLVYECLDLHRLMLGESFPGRLLRLIERTLMRKARLLIVSSPAFLSRYFVPRQGVGVTWDEAVLVLENKLLDLSGEDSSAHRPTPQLPEGPPWRIGWFGMIRCRRSLDLLCDLAATHPGLIEVTIRGRPARVEFPDFDARVERTPAVTFGGPYNRSELGRLYGDVHFSWAIDYFEEGANSALLLPNRIYEGGCHGAVPIALAETETGHWLKRRGLGVLFKTATGELPRFFEELTPSAYSALKRASASAPRELFVADHADCEDLMSSLRVAVSGENEPTDGIPIGQRTQGHAGEVRPAATSARAASPGLEIVSEPGSR
jgi:hypothetical protein